MAYELTEPQYRFTRQVRAAAPKPGHHLATASLQLATGRCHRRGKSCSAR